MLSTMHLANPFSKRGLKKNPSHARKEEEKSLGVSWWAEAGDKATLSPPAAPMPNGQTVKGDRTASSHTMRVSRAPGATPGCVGLT